MFSFLQNRWLSCGEQLYLVSGILREREMHITVLKRGMHSLQSTKETTTLVILWGLLTEGYKRNLSYAKALISLRI